MTLIRQKVASVEEFATALADAVLADFEDNPMIYDGFNDKSGIGSLVPMERRDEPADAWGPGFIEHSLREDMEDLMRFMGFEEMRSRVAEIINELADGRRR